MKTFHNPVMLSEVLRVLKPSAGESYLDLTAGYAGHADRILAMTRNYKRSVLVDRDEYAIQFLEAKYPAEAERDAKAERGVETEAAQPGGAGKRSCEERVAEKDEAPEIWHRDFYSAALSLSQCGRTFDLILADFGVSSPQLDNPDRGFSFSNDGPLDMRMDAAAPLTALEVVNHYPASRLVEIFEKYGELSPGLSRKVAMRVVSARPVVNSTTALAEIVSAVLPRHGRVHPATRVFQALRIEVNDELAIIERTLPLLPTLLTPGGRVAIITFHSLEDRLVKNYFREVSSLGEESLLEVLTPKPLVAGSVELGINPRARSAKLRAARRV